MEKESYQRVEELLNHARFDEARQIVETMERMKGLTIDDQLVLQLFKSQILTGKGDYEQSLKLAETTLSESQKVGKLLQELDARIAIAGALESLGKEEKSLKMIEKAKQVLSDLTGEPPAILMPRKARLLYQEGRSLWTNLDPDRALSSLEESLALYKELSNKYGIALCLRNIGIVFRQKGDPDRAIEFYQKSLTLNEELDDKQGMSACLNNIADILLSEKGDSAKALEYFKQRLTLAEELDNKSDIAFFHKNLGQAYLATGNLDKANESFLNVLAIIKDFNNKERLAWFIFDIAHSYNDSGELNQALEYFQKSFTIFEEIEDPFGIAESLNHLGWTYCLKGELETALEYQQRSLSKHDEIDKPKYRVVAILNLATIYQAKGEFDKAFEYFEKTITLSKEVGFNHITAWALYRLVSLNLDVHQLEEAKSYSHQLKDLHTQVTRPDKKSNGLVLSLRSISQLTRLAEGLLLKRSPRLKNKVRAQEIFQQVAEEETIFFDITSIAMFNLCELLLFELKASGEEEVLKEAKNLVQQFVERAQKQHSYSSVVDAKILQAKLAMVEGDLTAAAQFADEAQKTAEEKGLIRLAEKASTEKRELKTQFDNWQRLIQTNAPFQARLKQAQLEDYLITALKVARK